MFNTCKKQMYKKDKIVAYLQREYRLHSPTQSRGDEHTILCHTLCVGNNLIFPLTEQGNIINIVR